MSHISILYNTDYAQNTTIDYINIENMGEKNNLNPHSSFREVSEVSDVSEFDYKILPLSEGLDFMLWHFDDQILPLFPRNISTATTQNGQRPVGDRDKTLLFYQGALRQDCKISCYPNYQEMAKSGLITPDFKPKPTHLFMEFDLKDFDGDRDKLDLALKNTQRNIKRHLNGAIPTIVWSGGGYHLHQPLDGQVVPVFEDLAEFKRFDNPSVMFMRYVEIQLSGGKADKNHRISFESCMTRVPGSENSKPEYTTEARQVRIIQSWNGVRAKPTQQFMLTDFLAWLAQREIDYRIELQKRASKWTALPSDGGSTPSDTIVWIDRLLQTPIPDYRQTAVALILAPYLLTVRRLAYQQALNTILVWAKRCHELSNLRPNNAKFLHKVRKSLDRAQLKHQLPIRWSTLIQDYGHVYETLKLSRGSQ